MGRFPNVAALGTPGVPLKRSAVFRTGGPGGRVFTCSPGNSGVLQVCGSIISVEQGAPA